VTGHLHAGQDVQTQGAIKCGQGIKTGGDVRADKEINAGSGIQAGGAIECGEHLASGWGIIAGGDIRAQGSIRAGEGVQADGLIQAGDGHGVYAGLSVRLDAWSVCALVIAQARPAQLVSGHWAGAGAHDPASEPHAQAAQDNNNAEASANRPARPMHATPALA